MKLRDIAEYRSLLTDGKPIEIIGTGQDALSQALFGKQDQERFQNYLVNVSHFAESYQEQLIYELLQNADDEEANGIYFGFDNENFIVMNNGNPFSTSNKTDAELKFFLDDKPGNKGKNKKGKWGKGSKLLYNLIPDNDGTERDIRINKALVNKLKGPIIFSWNKPASLKEFLSWKFPFVPEFDTCLNIDSPLLCKIVQTYYPAYIDESVLTQNGKKELLFSKIELQEFQAFVKKVIVNHLAGDHYRFDKGTIIYFPVGKNQIPDKFIERVSPGARGYLGFSKQFKFVKINDYRLPELDFIDFDLKNSNAKLAFPKEPSSLDGELINFFQNLPILKSTYGLKFIVNSHKFDVLQNRQTFEINSESGKSNYALATRISKDISALLGTLSKDRVNYKQYISLIKAIVSYNEKENIGLIRKVFIDDLLEKLKKLVPSSDKKVLSYENVKFNASSVNVKLDKVLPGKHWLATELDDIKDYISPRLDIEELNVVDLIRKADKEESLSKWLNGLSDSDYEDLLSKIAEATDLNDIQDLKYLRCSDNTIRSVNDLLENKDCLITTSKTNRLTPIFNRHSLNFTDHLLKLNKDIDEHLVLLENNQVSGSRILTLLGSKKEEIDPNEARLVLDVLVDELKLEVNWLRENFELFRSFENLQMKLSHLMKKSNSFSGIDWLKHLHINRIQLKDSFPDSLFLQDNETWTLVFVEKLERTKLFISKFKSPQYYIEVKSLTESAFDPSSYEKLADIPFLLNGQNFFSPGELYFTDSLIKLSEKEYNLFESVINDYTNLNTLPYNDLKPFHNADFKFQEKNLTESILANQTNIELNTDKLAVITKIYPDFFKYFHPSDDLGTKFYKKEDDKSLFYSSDEDFVRSITRLYKNAIFLGVNLVDHAGFSGVCDESEILQDLIENNITVPENEIVYLIDYALLLDDNEKRRFIELIDQLNISSSKEDYTKDNYQDKLIRMAFDQNKIAKLRSKTYLDKRPISDYKYENNIVFEKPKDEYYLSDLLPEKYGNTAETLDKTIKHFKDLDGGTKSTFFTREAVDSGIIYNEIIVLENHTAIQIAFAIAYHQSIDDDLHVDCNPGCSEGQLLDEFYNRKYKKFNNYYHIGGFDLTDILYTTNLKNDEYLLLNEEKPPRWLKDWVNEDEEKLKFLYKSGLCESHQHIISVRRSIKENVSCSEQTVRQLFNSNIHLNNTLQFFVDVEFPIESNSSFVLKEIFSHIEKRDETLVPLRLLSYKLDKKKVKLVLKNFDGGFDNVYYSTEKELKIITKKVTGLQDLGNPHGLFYGVDMEGFLEKRGLSKIELVTHITENDLPEWDNSIYQEWSQKYGHKIFLSTEAVKQHMSLIVGEKAIYNYAILKYRGTLVDDSHVRYLEIYVNTDNTDEVLSLLVDEKEKFFSTRKRLEDFFNLYQRIKEKEEEELRAIFKEHPDINSVSDLKTAIEKSGVDKGAGEEGGLKPDENHDVIQIEKGLSDDDKKLLTENAKEISEIVNKFELEKLRELFEKVDDLDQLLKDHEEKESTVNKVYGYLGEALFNSYLEKKRITNFNWSSQGTPPTNEYDFELAERRIDIKTNIGSLIKSDGSLPFYIHKSQLTFIKDNPQSQYDISRIGLSDLHLDTKAKELNGKYQKSNEEEIPESLKIEINQLADNYISKNIDFYENLVKNYIFGLQKGIDI